MPLFKSNTQRERDHQNRETIDRAHHDPSYNPGVEHRQGHLSGQGEYRDNTSLPVASGPGGFGSQQQPADTGHGPTGQHGTQWDPAHTEGHHAQGIPPASTINHDGGRSSSTGSGRLTGKVEAAVGSFVGSQSLKAKGEQKQHEAEAYKRQAAELSEAERLEQEARVRRERAVAHGAHPGNLKAQGQDLAGGGTGHAGW